MKKTLYTLKWSILLGSVLYLSIRLVNNLLRGTPIEDTPLWMYLAEWFITVLAAGSLVVVLNRIADWHQRRGMRPIRELLLVTLSCLVLFNFWTFVPILLIADGGYDPTNFFTVTFLGWLWMLVYYLVLRGRQFLDAYVASKLEAERLEREKLQEEIKSLKAQVNPHFLFNSLNTLSELVMENPQAEAFVDKLASVYRYMLQSNHELLYPLEKEIKFIQAYFHLLETRHGSSIRMEYAVAPELLSSQIPPLTLQLLVENAVKHNAVSEESPLAIRLFTEGEYLIVENNIQPRSITVPSNKVGLSTIAAKYQLLGKRQINVLEQGGLFRVELPLLPQ